MRKSSNDLTGAPTFHLKVKTQEDGTVVATCPAQPKVAPFRAESETKAINGLRMALEQALMQGKLDGK